MLVHMTDETDDVLDAVGDAFSRLRRRTTQVAVDPPVSPKDLTRNLIINLIDEADGDLTVGDVAQQLAVSPSVGSRMVSDCIEAGIVRRVASQQDGRKSMLELTDDGRALRNVFRRQYRHAFEQITHDWPDGERREFARLLLKYADATTSLRATPPR